MLENTYPLSLKNERIYLLGANFIFIDIDLIKIKNPTRPAIKLPTEMAIIA